MVSVPEVENESDEATREEALEEAKQALEQDPAVETVDYNYLRETSYTPNDPRFGAQYGLENTRLDRAWDINPGQRG